MQRGDDRDRRGVRDRSCRTSGRSTRRRAAYEAELSRSDVDDRVDLRRLERRGRDLEDVLARAGVLDALDLRVGVAGSVELRAHACSTVAGLLQCRGDARARLEVDAEVDALAGDRQRADQQDHAGHREEPLRRPHEVEPEVKRCLLLTERGGRAAGACCAASTGSAWVASTAVNSDTITPRPSMNAKPLTPAVARMNRMNATRNVTMFASAIAVRPLR